MNQYDEHLSDSSPCGSRWDGFDRGDLDNPWADFCLDDDDPVFPVDNGAAQAIYHDIWNEILRGDHDTSDGHAPDSVGQDIDGNWFVSYPPIVDGGIRWENTVRSI